jgi:hypothetical protein
VEATTRRPTQVEQLGEFAANARYEDLSDAAREQLKLRVLDSLGCALGALGMEVPEMVREHTRELGGSSLATLIGSPDRTAPRSTTARSSATSTSTTRSSRPERPAIPPTTSRRCSPPPSTRGPTGAR